jgi:hypothetical protein
LDYKGIIVSVIKAPWYEFKDRHHDRKIHGTCRLPHGYTLAAVPRDAAFLPQAEGDEFSLSSNYSAIKAMVAIAQSIYAGTTLYNARGDQINKYGYAAFGLTVTPYLVMSIVNLIGALITPQYPCLYVVGSTVLDEARRRNECHVDGTVGRLIEIEASTSFEMSSQSTQDTFSYWTCSSLSFKLSSSGPDLRARFNGLPIAKVGLASWPSEQTSSLELLLEERSGHVKESFDLPILTGHSEENDWNDAIYLPTCPLIKRTGKANTNSHVNRWGIVVYDEEQPRLISLGTNRGASLWAWGSRSYAALTSLLSLAIIGGLSHFNRGSSSRAQRGWTMAWWVVGVGIGVFLTLIPSWHWQGGWQLVMWISLILSLGSSAIGGFIVVGEMFVSYGQFIRIT